MLKYPAGKWLSYLLLALAAGWILAACASPIKTDVPDPESLVAPQGKALLNQEPGAAATQATIATQGAQATLPVAESIQAGANAQESSTPPAGTDTIRTQLEASDPSAVQLASGQVQMVEFFAFW
ncbi:MAG TPA: hypothetical protein VJ436_07020 [Anaerolineales bacterium]|nr:hypothetical protein [Anaerolineales bacterium]